VVTQTEWFEQVDALQVDLYDQDAHSPVHDSQAFYADCRQLLTPNGCLVVNLFGHGMNFQTSMQNIAHSFGEDALWAFKPTPAGNTIALAFRTPQTEDKNKLLAQAKHIEAHWPLPAMKWLKTLSPYVHS
jgi:spermidine synthase